MTWALNLVLSYTGRKGDLVVDTGSLDQAGRYNMPVLVQPLDESLSQESPFWTVADGWDTMYLLWNWTDKAEDVVVTFYYSDGSGHFKLPMHLEAQGSATIDMAKVVARGQPDAEGNVIPARVRQGSAVFASPKGVTSPIEVAIWGAHFSARLGVAEACCLPCLGYSSPVISLSSSYKQIFSFAVPVGQTIQLYALATYSNGTVYNFTASATWKSSDPAVASVAGGLVTAVAGGSSQITASISLVAPGAKAFGCGGCPGRQLMTAGATADVCDFDIKPTSVSALCDGQVEVVIYTSNFSGGSGSGSCYASSTGSSCSATASGNVDIQTGYPRATVNGAGQLQCQVNFFAGPKLPGSSDAGTITPTLTVKYGGSTNTQTKSLETPVSCP